MKETIKDTNVESSVENTEKPKRSKKKDQAPTVRTLGMVTDCVLLKVRTTPEVIDGNVVAEIPLATELAIDMESSTEDFYKVITNNGIEGYCMKKFVNIGE